ncbi:acetyltransferase [Flavobacteriaceae bacterium GSB9]|nr:acetyltransferase [Flavobacteriaceae bacterium GSB9]
MAIYKNKTNVVIIGASGHAKVVIDIVERLNQYSIVGLIDSFKPIDSSIYNYRVLGNENDIPRLSKSHNFKLGIIAIGDNWTRKLIYEKIKKISPDFDYISAIHPNAVIGKNVKIGKGTVIMAGAVINSDANIGKFCIVNTKASLGHDSILKKYASLAPNSTIGGKSTIGACSAICMGAIIIQDISIGKHSIIGAAALINKNISDYKMVYGIPGKIIKSISEGEKYF